MKEKVELPMNKKPYIHSNISRASLFSVLTSEEYSGRLNAVISRLSLITDDKKQDEFQKDAFSSYFENMQMEIDQSDKVMKFYSHPYAERKHTYFYQTLEGHEAFTMEAVIDYIQDSNADSHVKLVLSKGRTEADEEKQDCGFLEEWSLQYFSNGNLFLHSATLEKDTFLARLDTDMPVTLKFEKSSFFTIQYSQDRTHWTEVYRTALDFEGKIEAGLYIAPKINPFYYDFFTSHIQLCYTSDNKIIAPHFDYYERYFSRMVPIMQIPMSMIDISSKDVIDYFIDLISQKYYINMGVDEFYIPGRDDYQKQHRLHVNFLYGFDKERRVFQLIGFDRFMKFSEIDFDSFFHAIQRRVDKTSKINIYRYCSKNNPDTLNLDAVIYILKAYLSGSNSFAISSSEIILEDSRKPIVYGLNIHELICRDEEHMSRFLRDIRIIYQIYEHNLIMREMLTFIHDIQILSDKCYEMHSKTFDTTLKLSSMIKNIVLKNRIAPQKNIEVKVRDMLMDLKRKESEAIESFIASLEACSSGEE